MEKSFPRKSIKTTPRFYFAFFMFSLLTFTLYFYFQPSLCFDLCWKHCFRHDKFPTRPWHHNRSALANLVLFCFFFASLTFTINASAWVVLHCIILQDLFLIIYVIYHASSPRTLFSLFSVALAPLVDGLQIAKPHTNCCRGEIMKNNPKKGSRARIQFRVFGRNCLEIGEDKSLLRLLNVHRLKVFFFSVSFFL